MVEAKRYDIKIYDEDYSILSDESEQQVQKIAKQVDELMKMIAQRTGLSDVKKIAVLTALKLATGSGKFENDLNTCVEKQQAMAEMINRVIS